MNDAKAVTITLDKERTIIYNNRAEYRMGSLDRPFTIDDLRKGRKRWAALVAWVWACLSERDALDLGTPDEVAPLLGDAAVIGKAFEAFVSTYAAAQPSDAKNGQG